ncbi:protein phosphatase 1H-like isoform X1 [Micropterus dolomieu]|uniref:protein phosphatase 1H-like isoform X1 n=1 Tax=Micropterus dolomieu TaxID=147949 RepID=UPI001E8D2BD6|nr:protein phosphatase 1H-like isoform X1 [Micropterus dolomieu]
MAPFSSRERTSCPNTWLCSACTAVQTTPLNLGGGPETAACSHPLRCAGPTGKCSQGSAMLLRNPPREPDPRGWWPVLCVGPRWQPEVEDHQGKLASDPRCVRPIVFRLQPLETGRCGKLLSAGTEVCRVINAGKSALNEDQACCEVVVARRRPMSYCPASTPSKTPTAKRRNSLPNGEGLGLRMDHGKLGEDSEGLVFHYWALFDGHAGSGAAVVASRLLQHHIACQLQAVIEILRNPASLPPTVLGEEPDNNPYLQGNTPGPHRALNRAASLRGAAGAPGSPCSTPPPPRFFTEKKVQHESLVIGAIENAFKEMDAQIEKEKQVCNITGGCTALTVVYLLGKLYVGNAGDSRAIIIRNNEIIPMSTEFTPESERQRLQFLGFMQPHLLGNEFTHLEFPRRVQRKEVGKRMLYRDFTMNGWAYKTIEDEDLKFPLIYGEGKKARVLATIGVTRGLGDHDLKVHDSNIYIKPFLSCCPEVKVYNLTQYEHGADDVLVMGTDGLWDVLSNQEVAEAVTTFLANCDPDDLHRYTMAAQDLVMRARGVLRDRGWRITNERLGSGDDISAFIIPLMYGNRQP